MLSKRSESKNGETPNIKANAPPQLIHSKNYNECDFVMSMLSEHCALGTGFTIVRNVEKPVVKPVEKRTCEDISLMLERCILDGHDCKTNLYKFNVLCKGDIDTKL
jgi:hypothetical protein